MSLVCMPIKLRKGLINHYLYKSKSHMEILVLILLAVIVYLLYHGYKYQKRAEWVIFSYLTLFKVLALNEKTKDKALLAFWSFYEYVFETALIGEHDSIWKSLAKAWTIIPTTDNKLGFIDSKKIALNIVQKIAYSEEEPSVSWILKYMGRYKSYKDYREYKVLEENK